MNTLYILVAAFSTVSVNVVIALVVDVHN